MASRAHRIKLEADTDLSALVEEVRADGGPRVLERDGQDIAVILSPNDYADLTGEPKSRRNKAKALSLAGAWRDLDGAAMIEEIYRHRHETPSSAPLTL